MGEDLYYTMDRRQEAVLNVIFRIRFPFSYRNLTPDVQ
jgi:hypothetical protein